MKLYDLHVKLTEEEAFLLEVIIDAKMTTKSKIIRHLIKECYKEIEKDGR